MFIAGRKGSFPPLHPNLCVKHIGPARDRTGNLSEAHPSAQVDPEGRVTDRKEGKSVTQRAEVGDLR